MADTNDRSIVREADALSQCLNRIASLRRRAAPLFVVPGLYNPRAECAWWRKQWRRLRGDYKEILDAKVVAGWLR